jgi:outer membrane protein OmpA-like peptidoglycan-associated protein
MPGLKKIFIGILLSLLAASCGSTGKEISGTTKASSAPVVRSFAVLPVADYSYIQDVERAHRQQSSVQGFLAQALESKGFKLASQPKTFRLLIQTDLIREMSYDKDVEPAADISSLQSLLNEELSDMMKSEIVQLAKTESRRSVPGLAVQDAHLDVPRTAVLDREAVIQLGRELGVDFILRGRLLEYDLRQEYKVEPLRRQALPFFQGVNSLQQFGVARATHYDDLDNLVVGGALTELGRRKDHGLRLQLWAHDAATGEVVWTKRTIKSISGNSFDSAAKNAVDELIGDFAATVAVDNDRDGVWDYRDLCPGTPLGVAVDASGCPPKSPRQTDSKLVMEELPVPEAADDTFLVAADTSMDDEDMPWLFDQEEDLSIDLLIQFDHNQADIKPIYHLELAKIADFLKNNPETKLTIAGHTDNTGTKKYNLKLSQRRAESVKKYLAEHFGIESSRLKGTGHGESQPKADNDTPEGRQQNRRAAITTL